MERFVDRLSPYLPGCPEAVIKAEVLKTAISFCRKTWIWRESSEKTISAGEADILFTPPDGSRIVGMKLIDDLGRDYTEYTWEESTATLEDAVAVDTTIDTTIYLVPTHTTASLPDLLYDDWSEAIEAGTKRTLFMMTNMSWYSPKMVSVEQAQYLHQEGEAKRRVRMKNDQTHIRISMRPFI